VDFAFLQARVQEESSDIEMDYPPGFGPCSSKSMLNVSHPSSLAGTAKGCGSSLVSTQTCQFLLI
jgi:hypothetical protein